MMRKFLLVIGPVALLAGGIFTGTALSGGSSTYKAAASYSTTTTTTATPIATTTTATPATTTSLQIVLTNTDDLTVAMNQAAVTLLGQSTEPGGDESFIDYYHGLERLAQRDKAAGKTYYSMDPEPMAEAYLRKNFPNTVDAFADGKRLNDFANGGILSSEGQNPAYVAPTTLPTTTTTTERTCSSPTTMHQPMYPCSAY